jgi:hypothetical protein
MYELCFYICTCCAHMFKLCFYMLRAYSFFIYLRFYMLSTFVFSTIVLLCWVHFTSCRELITYVYIIHVEHMLYLAHDDHILCLVHVVDI